MTQINLKTWEDMKKEELHTKANLQMKFCEAQGFDQWVDEEGFILLKKQICGENSKYNFDNEIMADSEEEVKRLQTEREKQICGEGK